MVPIYSLSSLASLFSLQAAFVIDVIRDVYEGFVIWSFFSLLVEYLGGERSLLILVHGRKPVRHPFPVNMLFAPLDISDPYTFLGLKRGILQYVQIKPILAVLTVVLKSIGKYDDGKLAWGNGYTWISITYNFSVFLSLYCLGVFWSGLAEDLAPFRVTSKFLCIKGIIFFSFWQGFGVSILVAAGIIKQIGPVRDEEFISLAVQDLLICLEMPLFALGHAYAFSPKDYIDPFSSYQSRLPAYYALRDAIGMYDVISDSLTTIRGTGYGYQTFEPSEGVMHQRLGRERRGRAGLRYTQGGKAKYWLPQRGTPETIKSGSSINARHLGPAKQIRRWLDRKRMEREGYAPLLPEEAEEIIHEDDDIEADGEASHNGLHHPLGSAKGSSRKSIGSVNDDEEEPSTLMARAKQWAVDHAQASLVYFDNLDPEEEMESSAADLQFSDVEEDGDMETLYQKSRSLTHGDYAFPSVDVQQEEERKRRWEDDENMIRRYKAQKGQRMRVGRVLGGSRSAQTSETQEQGSEDQTTTQDPASAKPTGVVDILVEDSLAEERERLRERRRGDPALRAGQRTRIFRRQWESDKDGKQRPELEQEEHPDRRHSADGSEAHNGDEGGRSESSMQQRVKADADREHHPDAERKDDKQAGPNENQFAPDRHAKVETAETGVSGQIAREIDAPGS
jgi:hypothetical protein